MSNVLSNSKIEKMECPFLYNQVYNLKNTSPTTAALERGRAVHTLFEEYGKRVLAGGKVDPDEIVRACLPAEVMDRASEFGEQLNKLIQRVTFDESVVGVEMMLAIDQDGKRADYDDPTALFRGRLDYVQAMEDMAFVRDYKTSPHIESQTDINEDRQLNLYLPLVAAILPAAQKFYLGKYFSKYGVTVVTDPPKTRADAENSILYMKGKAEALEAMQKDGKYPPRACSQCGWCHVINACPIRDEVIKWIGSPITSLGELSKEVASLHVAKQAAKASLKKIKEYMDLYELEEVSGDSEEGTVVAGWAATETRSVSAWDFIKFLQANDIEIEEVLPGVPMSWEAVKRAAKSLGLDKDEKFEKLAVATPGTKFTIGKE